MTQRPRTWRRWIGRLRATVVGHGIGPVDLDVICMGNGILRMIHTTKSRRKDTVPDPCARRRSEEHVLGVIAVRKPPLGC